MVGSARSEEPGGSVSSLRRWSAAAIVMSLLIAGVVTAIVVRGRHQEQQRQDVADAVSRFADTALRDPDAASRMLCRTERSAYAANVSRGLVPAAKAQDAALTVSDVRRGDTTASVRVEPREGRGGATRIRLRLEDGAWKACSPLPEGTWLALSPLRGTGPTDGARSTLCDPQRTAVRRARAAVAAHNAAPHVFRLPAQQAQLDAYDRRARSLNRALAGAQERQDSCTRATRALAGTGTAPAPTAPADAVATIREAGTDRDALAEALVATTPAYGDVRLQDRERPAVGDDDPAFAGGKVLAGADGPAVVAAPVVGAADLVDDPAFAGLTPEAKYAVANAPLNRQWASTAAAGALASPSMATVLGLAPSYRRFEARQQIVVGRTLDRVVRLLDRAQTGGR